METFQRSLTKHPAGLIIAGALVGAWMSVSCGPAENPVPAPAGGASNTSGSGGTAAGSGNFGGTGGTGAAGVSGAPATGGGSGSGATGGSSSGGTNQGGMSGSGGQAGSAAGGGGATGGMGGVSGTSGAGAAGGGAGGTGGASGATGGGAGGSGGKAAADPSAGCGKANPQVGSSGSPLTVSGHQYYVKLPTNYDASRPYPALFMFNPTGNPISWAEQNAGFESNGARDAWIRIYPHPANSSSGWGSGDVSFFAPLYDTVTAGYCIDRARVFAAGESSGGDFSSILGCEHANKLRAIAPCATKPVSQYPLDTARRTCTGQVTAAVIHGLNDNVVGPANGPLTRDFYVALNHCDSMTTPVSGYTDAMSNCVEYQGCDSGFPVYWCGHTDPEYSGTNHGWPRFAARFIFEKFSAY